MEEELVDEGYFDTNGFCNICHREFANAAKMVAHQRNAHRSCKLFCSSGACAGRCFQSKGDMREHIYRRHPHLKKKRL